MSLRVIALLAAYNEERYVAACLEHLFRQGVEAYLIDNASTDETVAIAEQYLGKGLVSIEHLPRDGIDNLETRLQRKEELAATLRADWFCHMDVDEFRLPPGPDSTLAQALEMVEAEGYNAVNFSEFVFIPTLESPNHEHQHFQATMRWYYAFRPAPLHRLTAWKQPPQRVNLADSGGHQVRFPGLRVYPRPFRMRHYHFLSVRHAIAKLVGRPYPPSALAKGWHGWRAELRPVMIRLPSQRELLPYQGDDLLDDSRPRPTHYLADLVSEHQASKKGRAWWSAFRKGSPR